VVVYRVVWIKAGVCVVVYSGSICTKSSDSGPGNLASLSCHTWGQCTKWYSLISVFLCLSERWMCHYSSADVAAVIIRFVRLALQAIKQNDANFMDVIQLYHRHCTALTWLIDLTHAVSI
jgi:hypothetical protein